jgi:hypothetical protein
MTVGLELGPVVSAVVRVAMPDPCCGGLLVRIIHTKLAVAIKIAALAITIRRLRFASRWRASDMCVVMSRVFASLSASLVLLLVSSASGTS